jgi:hypothetical protein
MKKLLAAAAVAAMGLVGFAGAAQADSRVQVGVLTCEVEPGFGLIFGSSKDLTCWFKAKGKNTETYAGTIKKFGIDVGYTAHTKIAWLVFAATKGPMTKHALAGTYVGASTEATLGVGLGGNWLIGGSNKSFALQPWSIQGQVGINWSLTWTGLTLE